MPDPLRPVFSVSVLIPTFQGAEFLDRVLDALAGQTFEGAWDVLVIDSGSTDGTLEVLERWQARFPVPFSRRDIDPVEFDHGDTRNRLAALSRGDLLVYLTQDAIPGGRDWLATLARNFEDPAVAAAYCRNVPRPDASLLTRIFCRDDPGYSDVRREVRLPDRAAYAEMDPHQRRILYNFNDVASAVRREVWERHPFPRTPFGEDVLMARALLEAGYVVAYDPDAAVEHSHDYDADQTHARAVADGAFNAEWLGRICIGNRSDVRELASRFAEADREALRASGEAEGERARDLELEAARLRTAAFAGLYEGGRSRRRRPPTRLLDGGKLHVLYVVHGFPPDTWAGTEIYTLNLARELTRRGHRCTIFARAPAPPEGGDDEGPPDFHVAETELEGLRVLRMTHRLEHANLAESYRQPKAERAFRAVLAEEQPDLVHFQHLIHTSAGLVEVAKEAGLPTVVHCHDYWALCARVQLIRPDGVRCEKNMGLGCLACVKEYDYGDIPKWKRWGERLGPLYDATAAVLARGWAGRRAAGYARAYRDLRRRGPYVLGAYSSADLVVSPSRFLRDRLLESGAFDPHAFLYSDNGMRTDHVAALEKRPDPDGRVRFGFVGSLVWYKGGEVLVRAMEKLGDRARLSFYGDFRPDEDEHHAMLKGLAGDNVDFRGRFDNSRLSEVYAEIDVLVVPSIWFENSPITIHEAFLTRTPVVASDIGGMAEYVRHGVDGLTFRAGDPADLAACLRRFLDEPELLGSLSRSFMDVKSIEDDAALTEARYRSLCTVAREASVPRLVFEGTATAARRGPTEPQGENMLLMRPGPASAEYDLRAAGAGARLVRVDVVALPGEAEVELGGRVLVDGHLVGSLPRFRGGARELVRSFEFVVDLPEPGAKRLAIENVDGAGGAAYLRVRRIVVEGTGSGGLGEGL